MDTTIVSLAEAKARLSELTELAATGETVIITKRGKPVGRLSQADRPRQPVDKHALARLTASMPPQEESAETFIRAVRDDVRY
ncbi:type II toxin-antitoxin system prevent-host-death family antitoxin [Ectothiorhodospiraceae bacterium 2226]|nr:type II toxin-antitoxin system prevent-host-death family antitoxin [Ectothiorhodospiraceae bacterium 2226]